MRNLLYGDYFAKVTRYGRTLISSFSLFDRNNQVNKVRFRRNNLNLHDLNYNLF